MLGLFSRSPVSVQFTDLAGFLSKHPQYMHEETLWKVDNCDVFYWNQTELAELGNEKKKEKNHVYKNH